MTHLRAVNLKVVLLQNGNNLPSIPEGYSVHMKETYNNIKQLLRCINYDQHQWQLCGNLKVVVLMMGLQLGYTKYSCFLCEWNSRAKDLHYIKKDWPLCQSLTYEEKNVQHPLLVESNKILLPPLHIKLEIMQNFAKAINKTKAGFKYLATNFSRLSEAKIKEGVFIGPQIRQLLQNKEFDQTLVGKEKRAWEAFKLVVMKFLGNKRADNYTELVSNLIKAYSCMGCNMLLKIHFFGFSSGFFPTKLWSNE